MLVAPKSLQRETTVAKRLQPRVLSGTNGPLQLKVPLHPPSRD